MPQADTPTQRFICIHGHFYQPPRENAWLEVIEEQESATPYHDWNARINHECYAANGSSRILDREGKIVRIVNNYSRIGFNFGPTLLAWMEQSAPLTYAKVLEADRLGAAQFHGHGPAIAQIYNHIVLPLAKMQDRITQIHWGIADFQRHFGRLPEGMWLAETAVDLESLDLLAQHGIRFTILAPHQCARARAIAGEDDPEAPLWHDTSSGSVDPTQPYLVRTREGRSIAVFFYDGAISRAVAFEGLLNDGAQFAERLLTGFRDNGRPGQLVHIATDGESYGHHHRYGDMALAYALQQIEQHGNVRLTSYGEFLASFPPAWEAEIVENTSWSCHHGIDRWRADCGCGIGTHRDWNQAWRAPLRESLDWLRDSVRSLSQPTLARLFHNPAAARDDYIHVVLDRSPESQQSFFDRWSVGPMSAKLRVSALKLMEMERHIQLMYTSCGWFFDDLAGIETVQIVSYAARVLQLAAELFGSAGALLEEKFLARLSEAHSNRPEEGNGADIYRKHVRPQIIGLDQVGARYAIVSLFEAQPEVARRYCFEIRRKAGEILTSGRGRFAYGQAEIRSLITLENESVDFAVLHLGDQNLSAAVRRTAAPNGHSFQSFANEIREAVRQANLPEAMRLFIQDFGSAGYSLNSLFPDDQRRILKLLLDSTLSEMESTLRAIYDNHVSLLRYLSLAGMPKPRALMLAAQFSLNADLRRALLGDSFDAARFHSLLEQARADGIRFDETTLSYEASQRMLRAMNDLGQMRDEKSLDTALGVCQAFRELPFPVDLWETQNRWHRMLRDSSRWERADPVWNSKFQQLGMMLGIAIDQIAVAD